MRVDLRLSLPPTTNEMVNEARTNRFKAAATKKQWTSQIAIEAIDAPSFEGLVYLGFRFFVNRFTSDHDNIQGAKKYLMDGLVQAGVLKDDSLKYIHPIVVDQFFLTKKDKYVIITISDSPIFEIIEL